MPAKTATGVFRAHRDGYGFVIADKGADHFIPPAHIGGALDGDLVHVAALPPRHGRPPASQIVEIAERRTRTLRGQVVGERGEFWVTPLNNRLPDVFIDPELPGPRFRAGEWVVVELTEYPTDRHMAPYGRLLEIVPGGDSPDGIIDMIMQEIGVPTGFSPQARAEADEFPQDVQSTPGPAREDLTGLELVTIDGEDARDFDDAVYMQALERGRSRLVVAIADVAHYVRPGTTLDADAYRKGTSVYFPTRVEPMLPERLSNELCSLQPDRPRLALVCDMVLDAQATTESYRIYEAVIRSRARLTYDAVQSLFDGNPGRQMHDKNIRRMLLDMRELAARLRARRTARGALQFVFPESRFVIDERGEPADVIKKYPTEATQLIEQFMLEANETVARHCAERKVPILYRVHDPPPRDASLLLKELLWNFGLAVPAGDSAEQDWINAVIEQAKAHPERDKIEMMLLRTLAQACYRHTNDGHFGLAAEHYTHFTSPIRRYPDLLVHRALKARMAGRRGAGPAASSLAEAGEHLSECERNAAEAERQVLRLFQVLVMEPHVGETFPGTVSGVSADGLRIELTAPYVEGFLPVSLLEGDRYRYDARENQFRGTQRGHRIGTGSQFDVILLRCDRLAREIEFSSSAAEPHAHGKRKKR